MRWMVSVKGVIFDGDRVPLAFNDRSDWELPGGRLEMGESAEECVERGDGMSMRLRRLRHDG